MLQPSNRARVATKPSIRRLAAGQILFRQGDSPGPVYVVCSGTVRVYRRDLTSFGGSMAVELARLGVGDVIGELAPILNQPRMASVQALESTQVLEIPRANLPGVLQDHAPLLRVISSALQERSGLSTTEIAAVAAKAGIAPLEA